MSPEKMEVGETEEAMIDEKKQDTADEGEAEGDDDAGQRTFYIDLKSNAGSDITNSCLGHSIDADGLIGKRVLKQADDGSGKGSGDRTAPGDREEEHCDEREIEDGETRKGFRQKGLQQNRQQGHQQRDSRGEGVLLEFSAGGVAAIEHVLASFEVLPGSPVGEFDVVFVRHEVARCPVELVLALHYFRSGSVLQE